MKHSLKKSKIVTIVIFLAIICIVVLLFLLGGKKTVVAPTDNVLKTNDDWKKYPLDNISGYPCGIKGDECLSKAQLEKMLGNKDDLISFSILPNTKVHGILSYRGVIQGAYFFEANIGINILDLNKKVLKASYAVAKTDWMTTLPVSFEGNIDFTGLPTGPAYFQIHNDNPSGLPANDKSILIPIIIY